MHCSSRVSLRQLVRLDLADSDAITCSLKLIFSKIQLHVGFGKVINPDLDLDEYITGSE